MEIKNVVKVLSMTGRGGRAVPNQHVIETREGQYFQSYDSVIAFRPFDETQKTRLDISKWNYSCTTNKYRNAFLGETTQETQKKIDSGEYLLVDLN